MSDTEETTRTEYQQALASLGDLLISPTESPAVKTPFVPCANVLFAQVSADAEIQAFFDEYFEAKYHRFLDASELKLLTCSSQDEQGERTRPDVNAAWGCFPPSCITLGGLRGSAVYSYETPTDPAALPTTKIARLFVGDLVWLFFMERMGLFRLFAKLVEDYASGGQFPVESGTLTGVTLESMIRQLKFGMASSVRDRNSTYRRCLGWTSDVGRQLDLASETNTAFNDQFHEFVQTTLKYNEDKRLAKAIQLTTTGASSAATRVAIKDSLVLLKESFSAFNYGRNYYNTLNGIVYTIATLDLIRNLRSQIGVPSTFTTASKYVSAAYYMLVEGKAASESKPNRYLQHLACANAARDLLLDIEKLDVDDVDQVGEWLDNEIIEERTEIFRKAYRDLTSIDLLTSSSAVEQVA